MKLKAKFIFIFLNTLSVLNGFKISENRLYISILRLYAVNEKFRHPVFFFQPNRLVSTSKITL